VLYIAAGAAAAQPDDDAQTRMKDAVDRGVQYLKLHSKNGQWGGDMHQAPGLAALVGWTLLETGGRPTDAEVKKAAEFVRSRGLDVTYTYSVSLAVLFLDRLGDPRDQPLIESLGARLLGGITNYAGWFYHCPAHSPQERTWVEARLKKAAQAAAVDADKAKKPDRELVQMIQALRGRNEFADAVGDHSNTQFAMMALWVARRHGVPVDDTLKKVEARFRRLQKPDGGWGYVAPLSGVQGPGSASTPSMACAGLLGLALGRGVRDKDGQKTDLLKDPSVKKAFAYLDKTLDEVNQGKFFREKDLYTLWSLERVAVVYDLKRVADRDWHRWGADVILDRQNLDGSWTARYYLADTCFALLFLKKANVAEDLTLNLQMGIVKDRGPDAGKKGGKDDAKKSDPDKKDKLEFPNVPPPKVKPPPPLKQSFLEEPREESRIAGRNYLSFSCSRRTSASKR